MALFNRATPIGRKERSYSYLFYEFSCIGVYFPWGYGTPLGNHVILGNEVFQAGIIV